MANNIPGYVKFIRGTPTAFDKLAVKDPDTLYFIRNKSDRVGSLYIGDTLISEGGSSTVGNLKDLQDVAINQTTLAEGNVLKYNWTQQKWVNTPVGTITVPVMTGATATTDGTSGLVPVPTAGSQNKFLRGDGTWVAIPDVGNLSTRVGNLETATQVLDSRVDNLTIIVNQFNPNLYALKADMGNIADLNMSPGNTSHTLIGEVNDINKRLTWNNY